MSFSGGGITHNNQSNTNISGPSALTAPASPTVSKGSEGSWLKGAGGSSSPAIAASPSSSGQPAAAVGLSTSTSTLASLPKAVSSSDALASKPASSIISSYPPHQHVPEYPSASTPTTAAAVHPSYAQQNLHKYPHPHHLQHKPGSGSSTSIKQAMDSISSSQQDHAPSGSSVPIGGHGALTNHGLGMGVGVGTAPASMGGEAMTPGGGGSSAGASYVGGASSEGMMDPAAMTAATRPSFQSRRSSTDVGGGGTEGRPSISLEALERIKQDTAGAASAGGMPTSSGGGPGSLPGATSSSSVGASAASAGTSGYLGNSMSPSMSGFSTSATTAVGEEVVPTAFDEATLRALCDMDCGMPLLFDRIKQSMVSAREAATFLKKRATIEEDYARSLSKLARSTAESYSSSDGKAGTFVNSWMSFLKIHDQLGDSHLRFSQKITDMSEELNNLAKEVDKQRRFARETGQRLEKNLQEAEQGVEKARTRFDSSAEDLERLLLIKSGESTKAGEMQGAVGGTSGKRSLGKAMGKTGLLFNKKNPQQMLRQEEEIRVKTSNASDAFRKEVHQTQQMRQEYFNLQLPRILRSLKESAEEIDNGSQYHLSRYAFLFESLVLGDGMAISPMGNTPDVQHGLKGNVEIIDNRADFKVYMQNYQLVHGRDYKGPKREGAYDDGFIPPSPGTIAKALAPATPSVRPIFGLDLATQMARDGVDVPPILQKCAAAIEAVGIQSMGIYRLSGTTSKVQRLKQKFDQDWTQVDLLNDEAINDINIVAGCLKLWFRELPEPLLTHELYTGFIEAAKIANYRLRHIRLHERVNELPDPNYATLKALMKHLDAVRSQEASNQMSASNLAIVFGPTLLSPPMPAGDVNGAGAMHLQDMSFQCKAVETILEKYKEIFVEDPEEE